MGRVGFGVAMGCAVVSSAIAVVLVGRRARRWRRWGRAAEVVREFEEGCSTSVGRLRQVVDAMAVEMHAGLASDGGSKLKMLLTFVDSLPDGRETGTYYALDIEGTYFRVLRVQLGGRQSMILGHQVESQPIPQHLMTGTAEDLFDFIAMILKEFVDRVEEEFNHKLDVQRELGFTFSFPVRQISVSSGVLIRWTKGFAIEEAIGKDITQLLEESMARRGLNMRVAVLVRYMKYFLYQCYEMESSDIRVIVNDTVGSLSLGSYRDKDTVAAVVIGTGTNACYFERTEAIIKSQGLLTNSGGMGFEKMISGMYLGEIARRVLYRIAQETSILGDAVHSLAEPFVLRTPLMAAMHSDDSPDLGEVGRILRENLNIPEVPLRARRVVVRVCDIVARRAARLAAAGIVGILKKIGRDGSDGAPGGRTVIAMDGWLYAGYELFREYMNEAMIDILGEVAAQNVLLRTFEDESGIGAALLAASHSSIQ
ncbi:Hexokinase-3 [Apostasia shenzhenica]|uniref:Phosphotransferase n=1 Tax=Apostasia shenzhenica TaxID=1088818 RepID=A0A2I0ASW0_9ASPA|nr:Hexokinase-3 [Apostasia shenzhenica]